MHTLALALHDLTVAVAANWSADTRWDLDPPCTPEAVAASMIDLARGMPDMGITGFIHPEFTPESPGLFGAWSY